MNKKYPYQIVRENQYRMKLAEVREEIIREFSHTISKFSIENDSNTPDFILAEYLYDCLLAANILICGRSMWYNPEGKGTLDERNSQNS